MLNREFKGYLHYKIIFRSNVGLDVQLMMFFICRKTNVLFSRYLDCVSVKPTDFKICVIIMGIAAVTFNFISSES